MEIIYEVQDGYMGGARPQRVQIPDSELADCEDWEEAEDTIEDAVRNHFEEHISPGYDARDYRVKVEALIKQRVEDDLRENQDEQ